MKKLVTVAFILLSPNICAAFQNIKNLYEDVLPFVKEEFVRQKLQSFSFPDFFKIISYTKDRNEDYKCFSFTEGTHIGSLFIVTTSGKLYSFFNLGPIFTILTKEEFPFLENEEILIISSTGGTGEHHVYGLLFSFSKGQVIASFPLSGDSYNGLPSLRDSKGEDRGPGEFHYGIQKIEKKEDCLVLKGFFETVIPSDLKKEQKKILNQYDLKSLKEPFTITLPLNGSPSLQGSPGVVKRLKFILELFSYIKPLITLLPLQERNI
ncbi:MAG: hypothetical protein JSS34_01395 [Proteobacteria bacterium]|nr:hypothetical protein [Pseudomonadota bacterium]